MNARTLIEAVVGVVIGLALFPVVSTSTATASINQTGAIAALLGLLPIVYVIILVAGAAAYVYFK